MQVKIFMFFLSDFDYLKGWKLSRAQLLGSIKGDCLLLLTLLIDWLAGINQALNQIAIQCWYYNDWVLYSLADSW